MRIRGGSTEIENREEKKENVNILVTTSIGTSFLDKKKKFLLPSDTTVQDLKQMIHQKFPGTPPTSLQKLYYQSQLLANDSQTIHEVMETTGGVSDQMPILLDMIVGTASYQKNFTVSQALEAYASSVVQLAYIGDKLRSISFQEDGIDSDTSVMDTLYYRELFEMVNQSLFERYSEDITNALEREKNPEYDSPDTAQWRNPSHTRQLSPLIGAIAKELDLNLFSFKRYLFFTFVLLVTAKFGTPSEGIDWTVLLCIPMLWLSKLRQLRLLSKIVTNFGLSIVHYLDSIGPLLPATLQVIAEQADRWFVNEELT
eukprot:gene4909-5266_t